MPTATPEMKAHVDAGADSSPQATAEVARRARALPVAMEREHVRRDQRGHRAGSRALRLASAGLQRELSRPTRYRAVCVSF